VGDSLIASSPIGVELPQKLNPGPLAARITFFAPVGLLFFVFVVAVLSAARRQALHPMHYFFIGCAFFAFHLLFAYLVDHLAIGASFALASVVSLLLVVSYARLFMGFARALLVLATPQLVYLVLFSATFFFEGYTGLAITAGAVLTLLLVMQVTGRVDWSVALAPKPARAG
jgi:inner membrane protein involved in colicin E2 resistance